MQQIFKNRLQYINKKPYNLCTCGAFTLLITVLNISDHSISMKNKQSIPVLKSIRPDGDTAKRSCNGRVIQEELISHHVKLFITTNSEIKRLNYMIVSWLVWS